MKRYKVQACGSWYDEEIVYADNWNDARESYCPDIGTKSCNIDDISVEEIYSEE